MEDDGPEKAQAIVVLGGDPEHRMPKAAQLALAGYAPVVFVSGPKDLLGYESDSAIEYARRQGFPASLFKPLPHYLKSTRTETAYIGRYLKANGVQKILLVTSNYHTHRAAELMRSQNPGLWVVVVAAPDPDFTPSGWWKSREGQKTFFTEWMKTLASWVNL